MANRSNIMGLHGLKNKTSKNSFDLSHRNLFTAKDGELIPCSVFELNPGDTINLDTSYFTRTAPLDSAAYTRLRENVQFFFISDSICSKASLLSIFLAADLEIMASATIVFFPAIVKLL